MAIKLFDSLKREIRELQPSHPDGVFRFCCGPTVYAPAHIGNFRTFVINDVLRRLLEREHGKDKVQHVRNLPTSTTAPSASRRKRGTRWLRLPRNGPICSTRIATRSTACARTSSRPPPGTFRSRST